MVKAWKEKVTIPTYGTGKPEKNPMFLEKRVYQGSSGVVYPYQVIESVSDEKEDRDYEAVFLENEYIKVMVLPELGGRIQMAWDKIAKRHFIYYNHVIKPALVGLAGPWISGGIEFNWPQHHRPSTFMPVDSTIEENADGSVTFGDNPEVSFRFEPMPGYAIEATACLNPAGSVISGGVLTANIDVMWTNVEVPVPIYVRFVSDGTSGIDGVTVQPAKAARGIYTISGRRVNATSTTALPAGLYIVDGKKTLVK